jgi:hypothetical protein
MTNKHKIGVPRNATGNENYRIVAYIADGQEKRTSDMGFRRFNPFLDCNFEGKQFAVVEDATGQFLVVDVWETRIACGEPRMWPQKFLPWVVAAFPDEDAAVVAACIKDGWGIGSGGLSLCAKKADDYVGASLR